MNNIFILTGPIKSGKTTNLQKCISLQSGVSGVVSPVINYKRCLKDIVSNETRQIETDEKTPVEYYLPVGKFSFDRRVFDWGINVICEALNSNPRLVIIDEIGHLELNGKGFAPVVTQIISRLDEYHETKFLFVVRDSLVEGFHTHFKVNRSLTIILSADELPYLFPI